MRERQPHAKSNHCAHPINNDSHSATTTGILLTVSNESHAGSSTDDGNRLKQKASIRRGAMIRCGYLSFSSK